MDKRVAGEPWKYDADDWQRAAGVHRPYIGEISQHQYASLSARSRTRYDATRAREWDASANCRQGWHDAVIAAHDAGRFAVSDPGVSFDARVAIREELKRRAEQALQKVWRTTNCIRHMDELTIGDRVYLLVGNRYGIVVKKNRKSVNVRVEGWERPYKHAPASLRWLSYDDLKEQLAKERS